MVAGVPPPIGFTLSVKLAPVRGAVLQRICDAVHDETVHGDGPIFTVPLVSNEVPVIVITVPPTAGPVEGSMVVILGLLYVNVCDVVD